MQPGCMNLHFNVDYPDITDIILILMKRPSVNKVIVTFQEAKKNVDSEGKKYCHFTVNVQNVFLLRNYSGSK